MKSLHRNTNKKSQWEIYKELELIPNSIAEPGANKQTFAFGLDKVWRVLIVALTRELIYEQQVEYLQWCWHINDFEAETDTNPNTLHKLWIW